MIQIFYKYQGTGNDFVMIDNRDLTFPKNSQELIRHLCDRRFGIGADGLILLENHETTDFKMVYYNADGNESTMCGNGGRCLVSFAKALNVINDTCNFLAIDGMHYATIDLDGIVSLQMKNVSKIDYENNRIFLDTGSPHDVVIVNDVSTIDVKSAGATIRYSDLYKETGCNINFVTQISDDSFQIRTYERGVEDETLSCGTGATAVAIAMNALGNTESNNIKIKVQGGQLEVSFKVIDGRYEEVFLKGPAMLVFKGEIDV